MFAGAIKTTTTATSFRNRAGNCILITIAVICVCVLVSCGVMIVREYALEKGYEPSTCQFINITQSDNLKCSYCSTEGKKKVKGKICEQTEFPCVQVHVWYDIDGGRRRGVLHMDSLQAIGQYQECSYTVCMKKLSENEQKVEEFKKGWFRRSGERFQCYYRTNNHHSLIENKKNSKQQVIHSMLWPSIVILICGAIFLKLETTRRNMSCCGVQEKYLTNSTSKAKQQTCSNRLHLDGTIQCDCKSSLLHKGQQRPSLTPQTANCHHSLEQLSQSAAATDYHSTTSCSKSLSCLERVGTQPGSKHKSQASSSRPNQDLLHSTQPLQSSLSETGIINHKLTSQRSDDEGQSLIPQITITTGSLTDSLSSHHETPV